MATLTIRVEDRSVLAELKKVLESMKGVVIVPNHREELGIEEAMDDIRHGRVTEYKNADDMFDKLGVQSDANKEYSCKCVLNTYI